MDEVKSNNELRKILDRIYRAKIFNILIHILTYA